MLNSAGSLDVLPGSKSLTRKRKAGSRCHSPIFSSRAKTILEEHAGEATNPQTPVDPTREASAPAIPGTAGLAPTSPPRFMLPGGAMPATPGAAGPAPPGPP
eukprot:9665803-Prorocentrum_lima.AAC.1